MGEFWSGYALPTVITVAEVLAIVVPLLLAVAYYTYAERKVLAFSKSSLVCLNAGMSGKCLLHWGKCRLHEHVPIAGPAQRASKA